MNLTVRIFEDNGIGNPLIPLSIPAGGITLNGVSNTVLTDTVSETITDFTDTLLTVGLSNYYYYSVTIDNVYDEDKAIDIVLTRIITNFNSIDYRRPNAAFFSFIHPCSFQVDVYYASSFPADVSFYLNNSFVFSGNKGVIDVCEPGEAQVKVRATTNQITILPCGRVITGPMIWDRQYATNGVGETGNIVSGVLDTIENYLLLDTNTNITLEEIRPSLTLSIESDLDFVDESQKCYSQYEDVTLIPSVTLPVGTTNDWLLQYVITGPEDVLLDETVTLLESTLVEDLRRTVSLDKLGVYTFQVIITDVTCNNIYSKTIEIETCDFLVLTYNRCNKYLFENRSSYIDATFTLKSVTGEILFENQLLEASTSIEIKLASFGTFIFYINYQRDNVTQIEHRVIHSYCSLEDCLSAYILSLLCKDNTDCTCEYDSSEEIKIIRAFSLYQTYFMKLQTEYGFNNIYTSMEQSKLDELSKIDQMACKLSEMCSRVKCLEEVESECDCGCGGCIEPVHTIKTSQNTRTVPVVTKNDCGCK